MGSAEITQFLTPIANQRLSASLQTRSMCAIVFLCKNKFQKGPGAFDGTVWTKRAGKLPAESTQHDAKTLPSGLIGDKGCITMLPDCVMSLLKALLVKVAELRRQDIKEGVGSVCLPPASDRNYPNAKAERVWRYAFPSVKRSADPRTGKERGRHLNDPVLNRAGEKADLNSKTAKKVTCHTLRHYATHSLEFAKDIRFIQELPGYNGV